MFIENYMQDAPIFYKWLVVEQVVVPEQDVMEAGVIVTACDHDEAAAILRRQMFLDEFIECRFIDRNIGMMTNVFTGVPFAGRFVDVDSDVHSLVFRHRVFPLFSFDIKNKPDLAESNGDCSKEEARAEARA